MAISITQACPSYLRSNGHGQLNSRRLSGIIGHRLALSGTTMFIPRWHSIKEHQPSLHCDQHWNSTAAGSQRQRHEGGEIPTTASPTEAWQRWGWSYKPSAKEGDSVLWSWLLAWLWWLLRAGGHGVSWWRGSEAAVRRWFEDDDAMKW